MMLSVCVLLALVCASPSLAISDAELALFTSGDGTNRTVEITPVDIGGVEGISMKIVTKSCNRSDLDAVPEPQEFTMTFFKNPDMATNPSCVPEGIIGIALDGRPLKNHAHKRRRGGRRKGRRPRFAGRRGRDRSRGSGDARVGGDRSSFLEADKLEGVALDGFPIYGPNSSDVTGRLLTSADLDKCGGRCFRTNDNSSEYRYHILKDFPFHLGCVKGQITNDTQTRIDDARSEGECDFKISCNATTEAGSCNGGSDPSDADAVCCNTDGDLSLCFDDTETRKRFPGLPDRVMKEGDVVVERTEDRSRGRKRPSRFRGLENRAEEEGDDVGKKSGGRRRGGRPKGQGRRRSK